MDDKTSYIKTDDNTYINQQNIIWVRHMNDCLKVGTARTIHCYNDSHEICKLKNPTSYNILYDKIKDIENK